MMARSKCSNQRPDTLMQDRSLPARRNHLQRTAGPYMGVKMRNTHSEQMFSALHPELGHYSMQSALRICANFGSPPLLFDHLVATGLAPECDSHSGSPACR